MKPLLFITLILISFLYAADVSAGLITRPTMNIGLVGYWNFDVGKGGYTAYDMSGNRNHGTLTNMDPATDWVDGKLGQALDFDGSNDYVDAGDIASVDTATAFSICAWVKHDILENDDAIVAKITDGANDGLLLFRDDVASISGRTDTYTWFVADSASTNNARVEGVTNASLLATWTYVCGTFQASNATGLRLYVNGIEDTNSPASTALIGAIDAGTITLHLGNSTEVSTRPFSGLIDEVRIYNRALSASEISRLYKLSRPKIAAPDNTGLVGYWSFNEGTGTVAGDASGNGNNGTFPGGTSNPTWTNGKLGSALSFDGTNDYVDVPDISITNTLTVSVWLKSNIADPGFKNTVSYHPGYFISGGGSGTSMRGVINTGTETSVNFDTFANIGTSWHHYVLTYNGSNIITYLDGIQKNTAAKTGNINTTGNLIIGSYAGGINTTYSWNGLIDNVRIYNRALSAAEVQKLYQTGLTKINASTVGKLNNGLVGHWTFDGPDMAGVTAFDRSGQSNNGTLTNGPTWTTGKLGQALSFDGTDDEILITDTPSLSITNDLTMAMWVNINNTPSWRSFLCKQAQSTHATPYCNYGLFRSSDTTKWHVRIEGYSINWGTAVYGQWVHLACAYTRSANRVLCYENGVQTFSNTSFTSVPSDSAFNLHIGSDVGNENTSGSIDEVRVYNRALTPTEIQRLYNMGR